MSVERFCDVCGCATLHEVVRQRRSVLTLRCPHCSRVSRVPAPKVCEVRVIVSRGGRSRSRSIVLPRDDEVMVGDELIVDSRRVMVTALDVKGERSERAAAGDVDTIWSTDRESVPVRFSINKGENTVSDIIHASPDEEIHTDTIEDVKGRKVLIHAIRTRTGTVRNGYARAGDIVRVYARYVRERRGR